MSVQFRPPLPVRCSLLTVLTARPGRQMKAPFQGLFVSCEKSFDGGHLKHRDEQIQALLAPTVEAMGLVLWGVEYLSQGRHTLLRVFIDGEQGVTVDDCAAVSRQLSAVLDVEDPVTGEYTLEVSSPGVDRLLFQLDQYLAYVGEWIEVRLRVPFDGRRKFKGTLKGVEGEDVVIQVDNEEYLLPHDTVDKAQVKPRV
jgi:ribosome maturation factor RimP